MDRPPPQPGGGGAASGSGDRLVAAFERWAASQRAAQAASDRSRTRWLAAQSASEATWVGILLDLAERSADVAVTVGSLRLGGRMVGVGRDFCVLSQPNGRPVVVSLRAVTSVTPERPPLRDVTPGGDRLPALDLTMAAVLETLMEERAPVSIRMAAGGPPVDGEVYALGADVLSVRETAPVRRVVHVPLAAVGCCELR